MRPGDKKLAEELEKKLADFSKKRPLPGIGADDAKRVLVEQIIESIRRIRFAQFIKDEKFSDERTDPKSDIFDPLRAAVYWNRKGDTDEASWLIFLFVHFGKHSRDGWRLVRNIYGELGKGLWTWKRISADVSAFTKWYVANEGALSGGKFSNHRKYETLKSGSKNGPPAVIESYVNWVLSFGSHKEIVRSLHKQVGQNPKEVFESMYTSMDAVHRFGRLAKFDYLTMLGKLEIAPIEPGSTFISDATGPLMGARLLFGGDSKSNLSAKELEQWIAELDDVLKVGMQVIEDSICNWQKSPTKFVSFRG